MSPATILVLVIIAALVASLIYYRKKYRMSQASADRLTAAAKAAADKITSLESANAALEISKAALAQESLDDAVKIESLQQQLADATAATGVPDTVADAASAELEQAVNPPAPVPPPDPAPAT